VDPKACRFQPPQKHVSIASPHFVALPKQRSIFCRNFWTKNLEYVSIVLFRAKDWRYPTDSGILGGIYKERRPKWSVWFPIVSLIYTSQNPNAYGFRKPLEEVSCIDIKTTHLKKEKASEKPETFPIHASNAHWNYAILS